MNVCGECGEPIVWTASGVDGSDRWYHTQTQRAFCYREPQNTETAYPSWEPRTTATLTLDLPDVLGYMSQCELCGQRAITREPHGLAWNCPKCEEANPTITFRTWLPGDPTVPAEQVADDDDYDLRKVQG